MKGFLILAAIICFYLYHINSNMVKDVTDEKIRKIEIGMTIEQVVSILNKPYYINIGNSTHTTVECNHTRNLNEIEINEETKIRELIVREYSDTNYCCSSNKQGMCFQKKEVTFTYSKHVLYPYRRMLWIHFDDSLLVRYVYCKQYKSMWEYNVSYYLE